MFEGLPKLFASSPAVFFRDDDADTDLPELRKLLATFGTRQVPLSLAVIPGTLDESGIRLLREAAAFQPLELHQHGWMHVNHEATGRKCEFGVSRGYQQQRQDIAQGQARLRDAFGARFSPIFTPPWNRCTATTRRVLNELGFRALSTMRPDESGEPHGGLTELPVAVDIFRWKPHFRLKTGEELFREFAEAAQAPHIGILLHHKVMSRDAWDLVERLMDALCDSGARFHSMEDLCPAGN